MFEPEAHADDHARGSEVIGRRIGAALLDLLVLAVVFTAVGIATGGASSGDGHVDVQTGTGGTLLFLALALAYYVAFEATSGQTLGKRALGVRVVRRGGGPAGLGPVIARTLLRVVDGLPFLYLVGFVCMLATGGRAQRLGDIAAGTQVVRA
jgi:uncharacterized RDD family membrane protein YckC